MAITKLIEDIKAATATDVVGVITPEERTSLLQACTSLHAVYEDPMAMTTRIMFGPFQMIALRLAVALKLLDLATDMKGAEISIDQLASGGGGDPLLIRRIVRILAGMNIFKEIKGSNFILTPLGASFVTASPYSAGIIHMSRQCEVAMSLPRYLEKTGYKNPSDAYNGPFQSFTRTDLHCFDYLKTQPLEQAAFNTVIEVSRRWRGQDWFEFYPVSANLRVASPTEPLLVDVGGSAGHDLIAFHKRFPDLQGTLTTQDIPVVIDSIKSLPPGITAVAHDFFTPQPIKGAKAYFLRNVLHDWPDQQARIILGHLRDAMDANSILLIQEVEMPESDVPLRAACTDLMMMAMFSAMERTRVQFRELLEGVGLELINVWSLDSGVTGGGALFETVLKV